MDKTQRQQIKHVLSSPQWKAVEQLAQALCNKTAGESPVRDTEWETLKTTLENSGRIKGIQMLIQELWNEAGHEQT